MEREQNLSLGLPPPDEVDRQVKVNRRVFEVLPDLGHVHLNLLLRPAKNSREEPRRVRLHGLNLLDTLISPHLLEFRVLGPSANGHLTTSCQQRPDIQNGTATYLANLLLHVHKPCLLHLLLPINGNLERLSELDRALQQDLEPVLGVLGFVGGAVVGHPARVSSLELDVPTRCEVAEGAPEKLIVVTDASLELARVDEVERLGVEPLGFEVVDLEAAVWRGPDYVDYYLELDRRRKRIYQWGWMGLRSVPITSADGYSLLSCQQDDHANLDRGQTRQSPWPRYPCRCRGRGHDGAHRG